MVVHRSKAKAKTKKPGKVLVTGFVSRQANPAKNKRDVMVSWMLAEALRDMGYEVEHRNPTMTEDYKEFDHVFLGLAALHSIGCNRSYGWLAAYQKAMGKVTLYVDDPDTAKVLSGIRVMQNDPKKLIKPYYVYRLEYELASQPEWHSWLMNGVNMLADNLWPNVIVPLFPWGDPEKYRSQLPNAAGIIPIDFSSYVPSYASKERVSVVDEEWVTECSQDNKWLMEQRHQWPLKRFSKGFLKRPDDAGLCFEYAKSWGVLDPGLDNGFFNSRLIYAADQTLYITRWQNVTELGSPYALLADRAEEFTWGQRESWIDSQYNALTEALYPRDHVKDTLTELLKTKVNA